jgi:hypothetical protein
MRAENETPLGWNPRAVRNATESAEEGSGHTVQHRPRKPADTSRHGCRGSNGESSYSTVAPGLSDYVADATHGAAHARPRGWGK